MRPAAALATSALVLALSVPAVADPAAPAVSTAATAAAATAVDISVDPRFELMGVVAQLAGLGPVGEASAAYRQRVEKRFARFQGHPAVELYKALNADPSGAEACATFPLYYTNPPELKLKDPNADIHYLDGGRREAMQRFLEELRAFARASNFDAFFRENGGYYRGLENDARKSFAGIDPVSDIERLLGVSLAAKSHYILAPLARETHDFIIPYPLPPASTGAKSFDAYTIPAESLQQSSSQVWPEPLYVFIDPSFHYFEKLNVPDPVAFYGPEIARCRAASPECTKQFVMAVLVERLNRARGLAAGPAAEPGVPATVGSAGALAETPSPAASTSTAPGAIETTDKIYIRALSARLEEYELQRGKYPTLWSFYPRLFSVFYELAHDGKTAKLSVPAAPAIRSAADFFDPSIIPRLKR